MEIFVLWVGLALLVGVVGKDRKIGFGIASSNRSLFG